MVTLEMEHAHAQVAHRNLVIAGVADAVDIRIGPALDTLAELEQEQPDGFDMIFIDADKEAYPAYWKCSMKLAHEGTLILADNVVRQGLVADLETHDPRALGAREYLELVAAEPRVTSAVLQTVGSKGYDGLSLAIVGARE